MAQHYDPHYERSQERHFKAWPTRERVVAQDLSDAAVAELARRVLLLG
jgi:tRNA 2-selenouridine synthase